MNKEPEAELAAASRRTAREIFALARRELSPDLPEPLAGVALSNEQARSIRELVEAHYAHEPIATPYGKLPIRDLVRGLEPPRPIRNPAVRAMLNRARRALLPPPKLTVVVPNG